MCKEMLSSEREFRLRPEELGFFQEYIRLPRQTGLTLSSKTSKGNHSPVFGICTTAGFRLGEVKRHHLVQSPL